MEDEFRDRHASDAAGVSFEQEVRIQQLRKEVEMLRAKFLQYHPIEEKLDSLNRQIMEEKRASKKD